ncbi:hypothetical protein CsSME_00026378 [Camellia sinensis var. sinensis]
MDIVGTSNLKGPLPGYGQHSLVRNIKNKVRKEVKLPEFEYGVGQRFGGSVNNVPTFKLVEDTGLVKGCGVVENVIDTQLNFSAYLRKCHSTVLKAT